MYFIIKYNINTISNLVFKFLIILLIALNFVSKGRSKGSKNKVSYKASNSQPKMGLKR